MCTLATFIDVLIALAAFWVVARFTHKDWVLHPGWKEMSGFIATGVIIIVIAEKFGTDIFGLWHYNELMPTLPFVGTGLLPILEWIALPPLIVWFARRQIHV